MKKFKTLFLTILVIGCNLVTNNAFADDDPGFPGNDPGAPVAAIDSWVFPIILVSIVLSFLLLKKFLIVSKKRV
jgi:hypothetical protein